ncbi:hypothetical protein [Paenibacillus lutrae]|uniref:hypothetical protein n=1 Tax=Paenibacillus lutrae TaxID=2078573 RepID=UPI001F2A3AFA|nr:hypothetical protein [Paenibacillus lutrae]
MTDWHNNSLIHRFDKLADEADASTAFQHKEVILPLLGIILFISGLFVKSD